jgi:hypothetical protein
MAYFRPCSIVISIKTSHAAQKNTSNMAATVGNVMNDVTCKSSIERTQKKKKVVQWITYLPRLTDNNFQEEGRQALGIPDQLTFFNSSEKK